MHDYKKVLQLNHEGKSQRMIASLMRISRHTISDILKTSELLGITYEASTKMSNEEIYNFLALLTYIWVKSCIKLQDFLLLWAFY